MAKKGKKENTSVNGIRLPRKWATPSAGSPRLHVKSHKQKNAPPADDSLPGTAPSLVTAVLPESSLTGSDGAKADSSKGAQLMVRASKCGECGEIPGAAEWTITGEITDQEAIVN